ncbi:MAG: hypothetical protein K0R55_975 [Sporomusa sp.]|jgi:hypothetical protein|nr:hypothetical protein [Sporomusa sp.]
MIPKWLKKEVHSCEVATDFGITTDHYTGFDVAKQMRRA